MRRSEAQPGDDRSVACMAGDAVGDTEALGPPMRAGRRQTGLLVEVMAWEAWERGRRAGVFRYEIGYWRLLGIGREWRL